MVGSSLNPTTPYSQITSTMFATHGPLPGKMDPFSKRNDTPPVPKIKFIDEGSPSMISQRRPEFKDMSIPAMIPQQRSEFKDMSVPAMIPQRRNEFKDRSIPALKPVHRNEFDDKSIQATSPLHRIELIGKSTPGMSPLCSTDSTKTMVPAMFPAVVPRCRTDSKDQSIPAIDEAHLTRRDVSKYKARPSTPKLQSKDRSIRGVESIPRIDSHEVSIPGVNPIRKIEPEDNSAPALSPIRKIKSTDTIIPTMSPSCRSDSTETLVPTPVKMRRTESKDKPSLAMDETHPIRKSTSEDKSSPAMNETTPIRKRTSKDKSSPSLRKIKSAISINPASPLGRLKDMHPHAISLLRAMCFFEPTDVRIRYLLEICDRYSSRAGSAEATLSDFPVQLTDLELTLNELKQERLIFHRTNTLGMSVKSEVRKAILNQLENMPEVFEVAFATAVVVLYELWPSMTGLKRKELEFDEYASYNPHNLWGGRDELVVHVRVLQSLFKRAKGDVRERCASRRYMVLLVEAAWYYYERVRYREADQLLEAAFQASNVACMVPNSLLANMHRTSAAIAVELGDSDRENLEVEQFMSLYREAFPRPDPAVLRTWHRGHPTADWAYSNEAILQSGLLAAAPDGVGLSPWGFDKVQGFSHLAPFLSLRYFGWMNYAEGRYDKAAKCFLQALGNHRVVFGLRDHRRPHKGELLYALGVVRNAQRRKEESFEDFDRALAQRRNEESFDYFDRALAHFVGMGEDGPSTAKTHYKLARHYVREKKIYLADDHLEAALAFYMANGTDNEYAPHLARVCFLTSENHKIFEDFDGCDETLVKAIEYREMVVTDDKRRRGNLFEKDFDSEVVIWAR